jgi:hypothetical protein
MNRLLLFCIGIIWHCREQSVRRGFVAIELVG